MGLTYSPLWLVCCLAFAVGLEGRGETVTFDFVGNVSHIYNPYGIVQSPLIQEGDPVQASLRYDTATADLPIYARDPNWGSFNGPGWAKIRINGLSFEQVQTVQVDVLHGVNNNQELFQVLALEPTFWPAELPAFDLQQIIAIFWETGPPRDFLSSGELPTELDFSRADRVHAFVGAGTAGTNMYEIQFSLRQVPEPGGLSLLGAALVIVVFRRRKAQLSRRN